MSGKTARQIRKEFNRLKISKQNMADNLVRELLNAPFKYRFLFAMKVLFPKRKGKK